MVQNQKNKCYTKFNNKEASLAPQNKHKARKQNNNNTE